MQTEFEWEDRYIVIKRSDLKKVPVAYRSHLVDPLFSLLSHPPHRECLVIESDWPEHLTETLKDEYEGLRVDAERWRFVRNPLGWRSPFAVWREHTQVYLGVQADKAIDAAMIKATSLTTSEGGQSWLSR